MQGRDILVEQRDEAPGRPQRQEQEPQERRLAGARRSGQEVERAGFEMEAHIAQHLRAHAIAQADIFEPNQVEAFDPIVEDRLKPAEVPSVAGPS